MRRIPRWFCAFLLTVAGVPARAQEPASSLTAADSAAVVLDVARRAQAEGRREFALYLFRVVANRFPGTPAADTAGLEAQELQRTASWQSGSATLAAYGALYGAWLGVAIPAALGAEEASPYGAGILGGIPAGVFAGRAYARANRLSAGQSRAIAFASIFGTFQAMGWRDVFGIGERTRTFCGQFGCFQSQQTSDRVPITAAIVGGLAGIGTAALLARSRAMSSGTVAAAQWGSLWGMWLGTASAVVFGIQGEDAVLTWALSGSAAGLIAMATQAGRWNLSASRPWLVSAAGIAGLVTGVGADLLFQVSDEQGAMFLPLAGSIVGLAVGARATRPRADGSFGLRVSESGALIEWGKGGFAVGTPTPTPVAQALLRPSGRVQWRPGIWVALVSINLP